MFRTVPLSIIRSFSLYTQQWYMSYRFANTLRAGSGCNVLILLASCQQTCMTYNIAVCIVKNSRWWTEKLSETCRDLFQNEFEKLMHLVGFILRTHNLLRKTCVSRLTFCLLQTSLFLGTICIKIGHDPYNEIMHSSVNKRIVRCLIV